MAFIKLKCMTMTACLLVSRRCATASCLSTDGWRPTYLDYGRYFAGSVLIDGHIYTMDLYRNVTDADATIYC